MKRARKDMKDAVEALIAKRTAAIRAAIGGQTSATTQNYTGIQNAQGGSPHSQTQSAANPVAMAAVAVQSKLTGLFRGDLHVNFASGTTAKTVEMRAVLVPFTAPATRFTQGVATNVQLGPGETTALSWGAEANADAAGVSAAGLLFNGVAPIDTVANAVILGDRKQDTLTGLLGFGDLVFDWSGICGYTNVGTPRPGLGRGNFALLVLELVSTAGGDVVTFGDLSMNLQEIG